MFELKTYKGQAPPAHAFYILNKGLNCGKPLASPCPNCFILSAPDACTREFYYWLCFGLWQSRAFHPYLCGSVIEFIHKRNLQHVIQQAAAAAKTNHQAFNQAIAQLQKIQRAENLITQQQKLLKVAKHTLFQKYIPKI